MPKVLVLDPLWKNALLYHATILRGFLGAETEIVALNYFTRVSLYEAGEVAQFVKIDTLISHDFKIIFIAPPLLREAISTLASAQKVLQTIRAEEKLREIPAVIVSDTLPPWEQDFERLRVKIATTWQNLRLRGTNYEKFRAIVSQALGEQIAEQP